MPNPHNIYAIASFKRRDLRDAYAQGLQEGINYECQPGSDPCRVRQEQDVFGLFSACIESGVYLDDGSIRW